MSARQSTAFGRRIVYGVTIVPLLVTLGFYLLEHVPSREEYFLNLHFRTLGVIGKQIETKLEAVSSGLTYARSVGMVDQVPGDGPPVRISLEQYVSRVFPGLLESQPQPGEAKRASTAPAGAPIDPNIEFLKSADRVRFTIGPNEKQWEDSLAHLIQPLTEDASFDDVLLAEEKGVVLFQRSDSTPRVREISNLLAKPEPKDSAVLGVFHQLHSEGKGSDTDLLREVELDGSGYKLFSQPLTIRVPRSPDGKVQNLLLCGLVRSDRIRQEAMHVPPKYLLWIIVPLIAGVLSGPLLKLILIRRTGRIEIRDVPLLALFSCLAMAMLTVILLAFHLSASNTQRLEMSSKDLADLLAGQVLKCFARGRQVLKQVDPFAVSLDAAAGPSVAAKNRTEIWSWKPLIQKAPAVQQTNLEFMYWTSADGFQIEKWTPLETNTPFYPQHSSMNYQNAIAGQYWRAWEDVNSPFTAELMISPTTSAPIAVLTMPSVRGSALQLSPGRPDLDSSSRPKLRPAYVSVVETPRNLLSPVIPPAMGFAFVRPDGLVLYHSDHDRILNENLFRETENSRALVDAVTTHSERIVEGRYRGNDVTFYVRPIHEVFGIPWTIVVFRDIEPWQMLEWQVGLDVLLLYLLLWALPVLAIPCVLAYMKRRRKRSWNDCCIAALRRVWPMDGALACYRGILTIEAALAAVFLILLIWFAQAPDGAAGAALLSSALLLPAGALLVWVWSLWRQTLPDSGAQSDEAGDARAFSTRRLRATYVAAVCLTLMCSSVLPVIAFFHLAVRMESDIDVRHWQAELADRVLKHRADAEAELVRPGRLSPEAAKVALALALPEPGSASCDNERLYESWSHTITHCSSGPMPVPDPVTPGWQHVLRTLRARAAGLEANTVVAGKSGRVVRTGLAQPILSVERAADSNLVVQSDLWTLPLLPQSGAWWACAALLLIAGCAWMWSAVSRLFLFSFHEIPLRTLDQLKDIEWNHPILVLGLPRSGKDSAVKEFIGAVQQRAGAASAIRARIDLKADRLNDSWLRKVLEGVGLETWLSPRAVELKAVGARGDVEKPAVANESSAPVAEVAAAAAVGSAPVMAARIETEADAGPDARFAAVRRTVPDFIHVTNLEAALYERGRRDVAMRLLDVLVSAQASGGPKVVVTSVVDPMFHFDIIFPDQNEEVERSQLPEAEFGRWAHVLLAFEPVLAEDRPSELKQAEDALKNGTSDQDIWVGDLWQECRHHRWLRHSGRNLAEAIRRRIQAGRPAPTHDQIVDELHEKAFALYELLWSACTRPEKLLLVQLAQTGLVNPICKDTLHDLIRKKLILMKPHPTVMNDSFARFLQSAATSDQIRRWEKEAGESHWLTVRNVLIIMVVFTFFMIGISQDHALQSISGILTAVVGGIGGVFKLVETVASKWGKAPSTSTSHG
jgi:hypothetical protein